MEEKVGLSIRNWDFSKQTVTDHGVLKPVSGIPVSSSTNAEHHPHPHHHLQHQHHHQQQHQQHQHQLQQQHQHQHQHPQQHPHPHSHLHPQQQQQQQQQQHQHQHHHHQAAFLKMGMYPNRHSMISESESETDINAVDYAASHCWVHQRSFLPPTKASQTPIHTTHINTETGLPVIPTSLGMPEEGPIQDDEFETKSSKTKRQSSTKKSEKAVSKALKTKEPKKKSAASTKKKGNLISTAIREKKNLDIVIDGSGMDFSQVPSPVCSCTGMPRQCYRWGAGGWQSSCCTTNLSEYPLPMSSTRPGSRLAGRKMSNGAYSKLLQRLTVEGYDLSHAIDLKDHWAKHGTNKFVTIK